MMKVAIAEALVKGHSYTKYRKIVSDLLLEGKTTGDIQSEEMTHYAELNEARMNRLDKKMVISPENIQRLLGLKRDYIWLVISEGWCGDAAQLLPIFNKMALLTPKLELKVVFRDENVPLIDQFLTNGSRSIPKLIIIDKEINTVCANWGPRPTGAAKLITSYLQQYGAIDETLKKELQLWYLHDKGISTQDELMNLMLEVCQRTPKMN